VGIVDSENSQPYQNFWLYAGMCSQEQMADPQNIVVKQGVCICMFCQMYDKCHVLLQVLVSML